MNVENNRGSFACCAKQIRSGRVAEEALTKLMPLNNHKQNVEINAGEAWFAFRLSAVSIPYLRLFLQSAGLAIMIILNTLSGSNSAETKTRAECLAKTEELREILSSINKKITALPPLAKIYVALKQNYNEAISSAEKNDYARCVRIAETSIAQGSP